MKVKLGDNNCVITATSTTPKDIWDTRAQWVQKVDDSVEAWNNLSAVQQDAFKEKLRTGLCRLEGTVDEWIEEGMTVKKRWWRRSKPGNVVALDFRILVLKD